MVKLHLVPVSPSTSVYSSRGIAAGVLFAARTDDVNSRRLVVLLEQLICLIKKERQVVTPAFCRRQIAPRLVAKNDDGVGRPTRPGRSVQALTVQAHP